MVSFLMREFVTFALLFAGAANLVAGVKLVGLDNAGTEYEFGVGNDAVGRTFCLVSTPEHVINGNVGGANSADGATRLRAISFQFLNLLQVEAEVPSSGGILMRVNGQDMTEFTKVSGSHTINFGKDLGVRFTGATTGHLLTIATPSLQVVVLMPKDGAPYLDIVLRVPSPELAMHGLLGQSASWAANNARVEGAESDYIVPNLLSSQFKYNLFGKANAAVSSAISTVGGGRKLLTTVDGTVKFGGSAGKQETTDVYDLNFVADFSIGIDEPQTRSSTPPPSDFP